jgi:hypothetical protein
MPLWAQDLDSNHPLLEILVRDPLVHKCTGHDVDDDAPPESEANCDKTPNMVGTKDDCLLED